MYKLPLLFSFLALFSCQNISTSEQVEKPKDYLIFSGKISPNTIDSVGILSREFTKIIAVNEDGSFKDTLSLKPGIYYFATKQKGIPIFLKNGYDLSLNIDAKAFNTSAKFTGKGAKENNYLVEKASLESSLYDQDLTHLSITELEPALHAIIKQVSDFIQSKEGMDSFLIDQNLAELEMTFNSLKKYHSGKLILNDIIPAGSPSPLFTDYENYDGTKTSLADLKGKNVYIDIWATWCGPCKAEIPALKALEQDYEGKNIAFVSISIDDAQAHQGSLAVANSKWRAMVKDKALGGIQLFAPKGGNSLFISAYQINSIPRFILLDTEGNIVNPSAPRPSDPKLRTLLDQLI
ncbi:MAG: Thioredoxin [uncultured Aureispira sp.]|uniref:Thioredoxin n=1 Tax=uncultured Aureispira sp. TaxID=1331704 RepID=A0A6S6TMM0_9BACT|nr:MAG: Thioredoxin [uncultured Aureispira sp.]